MLYVPKAVEMDGEVPNENVQSKWVQLKEKKLAFSKSEADMKTTKVFGELSDISEKE